MGNHHDIDVRPKNWLVPVALLTLREKSSHVYELMDHIVGFGFEQINPGTAVRVRVGDLKRRRRSRVPDVLGDRHRGGVPWLLGRGV